MFLKARPVFMAMPKPWTGINRLACQSSLLHNFNQTAFASTNSTEVDWEEIDKKSIKKLTHYYMESKQYIRKMDEWKKPLLKKQMYKARKAQRDAEKVLPAEEPQQFVVHDISQPVTYPQDPYGIFAVIEIAGKQYKVTKDCTVMLEKVPFEVGDNIIIDQVLMIGTKDYTSVGRPFVETARVYATVEEESSSEKVIIFKKRRRKGYQKNASHRQTVTGIRIENIVHLIGQEQIDNFKELQM